MSVLRTIALGGAGQLSLGSVFVRLTLDAAQFSKGWLDAENTVTGASTRMLSVVTKMTAASSLALTAMAGLSVREAARFEQSFAGVRRTVEATEEQFTQLSDQFRQMAKEMPVNINEINRIAESAGALGIPIEDMKEFTRVMAMMGSTTNMTSDQAAVALARIANIMDVSGEGFARMGATVLALGQSTVATESEIVEMGKRIAGAGNIVGLTTAQVLSLAAAFSSVGVRAEAGGTAMSQIMIRMSKAVEEGGFQLRVFADIAGMTGSAFQKLFREDAGAAIIEFLKGMKQLDESGGDVFKMLEELQIDGARVTAILLQAAGAGDKLTEWMNTGTRAWEENTALVKAAEERYKTFISQLTITWNIIRDILITIGNELMPALKALNSMLQASLKDTSNLNDGFAGFVNNVGPAFIYIIKQIGDILYGWRLIVKTGELQFLAMGAAVLTVFEKLAKGISGAMQFIGNSVIEGVNIAIRALNMLLPKAKEVTELQFRMPEANLFGLDTLAQALRDSTGDAMKELEALSAKGQFSDRFQKEYEKVTQVVKEENKAIVADVENTAKEVVRTLTPMSERLRNALQQLEASVQKDVQGPKLGADLGERGGALREFQDPAVETMNRLAEERRLAEENLALLMELDQMELDMTEAVQQKKLEMIEAYTEKLKALQLAQAEIIFSTSSQMFEDISSIAEAFAGRQSGIYKAMFAASKAFAVAESIIKIQQGIAAAASMPWPANLAAIASVVSATANIVSTIQSVKLEFAGQREMGGPVSSGKAFLVGEAGPELFVPNSAGNIVPNDELSGNRVRVVINNFTDAQPEVTERQEGNERIIEVMIRRTKNEISSEIRDGRGDVTRALESTFGLKRGKAS